VAVPSLANHAPPCPVALDDPDEATLADAIDPPDEEPTAIRPTPTPAELVAGDAAVGHDTRREFPVPARGRIGKYALYNRLARGAFGVVYTAHDPSLDRSVAIKVLRPSHQANRDVVQRFLQEARATARIAHPGIVTIHDCGLVETRRGPTAFIAMELLPGESLSHRLARCGPLDPAEACEIVRQVASALEAAHQVDVLHRDLKPDNIFLVPDPAIPSGERVKVLDFGLAKLGATGHTRLETVFGTPRYMSPEQGRSATQIDHRSDIYSLGCILFELVTGATPFDGDTEQLLESHQRAEPPRAASLAPELWRSIDDLIAAMLAKDPIDRPQTMGAVQRALRIAIDVCGEVTVVARPEPVTLPMPSVEVSMSSLELALGELVELPAVTPAPVLDDGGVSGEVVVPAAAGPTSFGPARVPASAAAAPDRRRSLVFGLCVAAFAVVIALAAAASF